MYTERETTKYTKMAKIKNETGSGHVYLCMCCSVREFTNSINTHVFFLNNIIYLSFIGK